MEQEVKLNETSGKFMEISNEVESSKEIVEKINNDTKTMAEEAKRVIFAIENLSAISEENAAATEEASAAVISQTESINNITEASENLAHIAQDLQTEVSRFKL